MKHKIDYDFEFQESNYARLTVLGRSFNSLPWIHEIPYKLDLFSVQTAVYRFRDTVFSGLVYSRAKNNTFMFFVMLWLIDVKKGIEARKNLNKDDKSIFTEVALKFAHKIVSEKEVLSEDEFSKQIDRFRQNR